MISARLPTPKTFRSKNAKLIGRRGSGCRDFRVRVAGGLRKPKAANDSESFAAFGFRRPPATRTRKSRHPEPRRPINFAFLLRNVFGVGSRAEIMRFLLTASGQAPTGRPLFTTLAVAKAAGFAKRNV